MKKIINSLAVICLLAVSGHLAAKDVKRGDPPPIVSNDIGPGVDPFTVPPAKSGSAGVVYEVLTGSAIPTGNIAAWVQRNGINKQQDGYGDVWSFDALRPELGWSRIAKAEIEQGGPLVDTKMVAGLQLTNYLNYKATSQAMTLKLPVPTEGKPKAGVRKP